MLRMLTSVAVLAAPVVALGITANAQAAEDDYAGIDYRMNVYENDGYKGCVEVRKEYDSDFGNDYCHAPASFNDRLSSFVNKTGDWWVLYEDTGAGGARLCVRPHSHDGNIGNDTSYEDDISSMQRKGTSKPSGCNDTTGTSNG